MNYLAAEQTMSKTSSKPAINGISQCKRKSQACDIVLRGYPKSSIWHQVWPDLSHAYDNLVSKLTKKANMKDFTITEDLPKSEIEFDSRFSKPSACYDYLFAIKWPNGFICKKMWNGTYWVSARHLYICTKCNHQHSLTVGTIMDSSKKPITYWFKTMWWFTTRKSGVNAVNLKELLGFGSYHTVWNWLQKLRRCTIRQGQEKLSGRVEVDEFVIGGQKSGKRGRGAKGKTIVVAAVERCDIKREIGRIRLHVMLDCSSFSLETFIDENVQHGSTIEPRS